MRECGFLMNTSNVLAPNRRTVSNDCNTCLLFTLFDARAQIKSLDRVALRLLLSASFGDLFFWP